MLLLRLACSRFYLLPIPLRPAVRPRSSTALDVNFCLGVPREDVFIETLLCKL